MCQTCNMGVTNMSINMKDRAVAARIKELHNSLADINFELDVRHQELKTYELKAELGEDTQQAIEETKSRIEYLDDLARFTEMDIFYLNNDFVGG